LSETAAPYAPAADPEREAVIERLVATYEAMIHDVAAAHAPEFLGVGVTMSQAKVLYLVEAAPGLRMSDLSARLRVSLSTVSGVVDRLVDQGLLTRRDDPADRRHVILWMTEAGATQLQLFRELNAGQVRALLARIDAAGLGVVEQALDLLADAAAREPAAPPATAPSASRTIEGEPA
jgi:DNA-binding MarR family transcriptional regulator